MCGIVSKRNDACPVFIFFIQKHHELVRLYTIILVNKVSIHRFKLQFIINLINRKDRQIIQWKICICFDHDDKKNLTKLESDKNVFEHKGQIYFAENDNESSKIRIYYSNICKGIRNFKQTMLKFKSLKKKSFYRILVFFCMKIRFLK